MARDAVHFELFLKANPKADWRLVSATPQRDKALREAQAALKAAPTASVRVTKEVFNEATGAFSAVTIFEHGEDRFDVFGREDRQADLPCLSPADLVTPMARDTIRRALKGWFSRQKVLALELLHRADLVEKLEATGSEMQHAVQKVAVARASESDASAQHFVKQINALVQKAVEQLYGDVRGQRFDTLKLGGMADLAAKLDTGAERDRRLRGALAGALKGAKTWADKFDVVLDFADEAAALATESQWTLTVISEFITELIEDDDARLTLLAAPRDSDTGDQLAGYANIVCVDSEQRSGLSPRGVRVAGMVEAGELASARAFLAGKILDAVRKPKRLKPADIEGELSLVRRLADRMVRSVGGLVSVETISEAFIMRSAILVQPEAIDALTTPAADPGDALRRLVTVEAAIVGPQNKAKLASFLRGHLGMHATERHFAYEAKTPILARLSELADAQRRVDKSGFTASDKAAIAAAIGQLAANAEEQSALFDKLLARRAPPLDKAAGLLRLIEQGVLPAGPVCEAAKSRARKLLKTRQAAEAMASGDPETLKLAAEIRGLLAAPSDTSGAKSAKAA